MSLDRKCNNLYYLTGRMVAVIEKSNGKDLSATQKDNILESPAIYIPKYDLNKTNMMREKGEIYDLIPAEGFPERMGPEDLSRFWVGYHHQQYAMPDTEVEIHTPRHISAMGNNEISELKK